MVSQLFAEIRILDVVQVLVVTIGGAFALYQYIKKTRFDRIKETPIVNLVLAYHAITQQDLDNPHFFYNFIDVSQEQDSNIYRFTSNDDLRLGDSYLVINMVSSNHIPAYNTWITLSRGTADVRKLARIYSHYAIIEERPDTRLEAVGTYILQSEYQSLAGQKLFITYQNIFREKFYDEFEISKNGKIKKFGTHRILESLGGRLVYPKELRM